MSFSTSDSSESSHSDPTSNSDSGSPSSGSGSGSGSHSSGSGSGSGSPSSGSGSGSASHSGGSGGSGGSGSGSGSSSGGDSEDQYPPICVRCRDCEGGTTEVSEGSECPAGTKSVPNPNNSARPIRYATGQMKLPQADLGEMGFGVPWGHTRSFANILSRPDQLGPHGHGWLVNQFVYLARSADGWIGAVANATDNDWFKPASGGGWQPALGTLNTLQHDVGQGLFIHTSQSGIVRRFYDFNQPGWLRGKLHSVSSASGRTATMQYSFLGQLERVVWEQDGHRREFVYDWLADGPNAGLLASVTLLVNHRPVRRCRYAYYEGVHAGGSTGDLASATVEGWDPGLDRWFDLRRPAYRYTGQGDPDGPAHELKMVFNAAGSRRLTRQGLNFATASDSALLKFSSHKFAYDSDRRVIEEAVRGGKSKFQLAYQQNPDQPAFSDVATWNTQTLETRPDGSTFTVYSTRGGQPLLAKFTDTAQNRSWFQANQFDSNFRHLQTAWPDAVASVTEPTVGNPTLTVNLKPNDGRLRLNSYFETTDPQTGAIVGRLKDTGMQTGTAGPLQITRELTWDQQTIAGASIQRPRETVALPVAGDPSKASVTKIQRTWQEDSQSQPTFAEATVVTTPPVVPVEQHGSGEEEPHEQVDNPDSQPEWTKNARGFITFRQFDPATGAKVRQINDVDTSLMEDVPGGWVTPEGGGKNLISDFENDDLGRNTLALGPWHDVIVEDPAIDPKDIQARLHAPPVAARVRTARMTLYLDSRHQRWEADGFVTGDEEEGLSWHILGDVRITVTDDSGNTVAQISATPTCSCGRLGPDTFGRLEQHLPRRKLWTSWTRNLRDDAGEVTETRRYHTIPKQGPGFEGEHYLATRYQRDTMDQLVRTLKPDGTIERTVHDQRGLVISRWVGTNDTGATPTDPTGNGAPGNNMKPVWLGEYDHGQPDGDGELTEERYPVDDTPANDRVITHAYDERGNLTHTTTTDGTDVFIDVTEYDNLDQPIAQTRYHTAVDDANRLEHSETSYDSQDRVYNDRIWGVDPASGNLTQPLDAGTWYDPNSNVIKTTSAGGKAVKKTVFDSLDDPIHRYTVVEASTPPTVPNDVSGDIVISQLDLLRDHSRQVIARVLRRRFHDATGTGPLGGPQSSQPRARCFWDASWHDGLGRSLFHAVYGTVPQPAPPDAASMDLAGWQRPALPPAGSATVLVSRSLPAIGRGPSGGRAPGGRIDLRWTDRLSGQARTLEAAFTKAQRETRMTWHASGAMHRLILTDPDTGEQVTTWLFGTTLETSAIARNDVVSGKAYPTGEIEHFTFNQQSEPVTFQDPNGTVHAYDRDKLARLLHDRIITLADDIDGLVRRLSTAYSLRGQVASVSSHDDPTPGQGTVLNEVAFNYNALRCLTADRQSHDGPVDGTTPEVAYLCTGGQNNTLRRTGIIYPSGRQLGYEYGTAGSVDDALNRVQSLHDEDALAVITEWEYLGLAMAAKTTLPQPGLQRRWTALDGEDVSDGGDPYVGYDRFDRTQRSLWLKDTGTELQTLVDVAWGYDQASLRTWRRDRSPGAPEEHQDQAFSYDQLYQLTQRQRGNLNVNRTSVNGYAQAAEDFDYDPQGNWNTYQTKENGQPVIDQSRTHNESNQITKIDGTSAVIAHDANGNTILVPTSDPNGPQGNLEGEPVKVIWDAWNRSRKVLDETDQVIWENHYDALTRRIITDDGTTARHHFYNDQWRSVEERLGTSTDPDRQYIWNPRDRWDLLLRDRDTTSNGTLDEHLWCLKDDLDPVAIADHNGGVVERYAFSAFGMPSILTPTFEPRSGNQSDFAWNFLFHGEFEDPVTGWMNYHYRHYSPELGRWTSRDPIGERGGVNLYGFVANGALYAWDRLGLYCHFQDDMRAQMEADRQDGLNYPGGLTEFDKIALAEIAERERLNPFITPRYFPAVTAQRIETALESIDREGRITDDCNQAQLDAVRASKKGLIRQALNWNISSPRWSLNNQCGEQASALRDAFSGPWFHPTTGEIKRSLTFGVPNANSHWSFDVEQRRRSLTHFPYQRHALLKFDPKKPAADCCFRAFVIDPFKWWGDHPNWTPAIRFGPHDEFTTFYPIDNNPPEKDK